MSTFRHERLAVAVVTTAAATLLSVAPGTASATSDATLLDSLDPRCTTTGYVCVFETAQFTGKVALYQDVDTECVTAPFGILADINMTDKPVAYYKNADCTGASITEAPTGFHSWETFGPTYSFRQK